MEVLLIALILLLLLFFVLFYYLIQQRLNEIALQLTQAQNTATKRHQLSEQWRRERAAAQDQLAILEAQLSLAPRDDLTQEEFENIDVLRQKIRHCVDELKSHGDWLGLPMELEVGEMMARFPNIDRLYRKKVAAETTPS
mgnify:CR=1 FL=1